MLNLEILLDGVVCLTGGVFCLCLLIDVSIFELALVFVALLFCFIGVFLRGAISLLATTKENISDFKISPVHLCLTVNDIS